MSTEAFTGRLPKVEKGNSHLDRRLADLVQGVAKGQPVQVLRGPPGCGKSAILLALRRHISNRSMVVMLNSGLLNETDFLALILCEASLESDISDSAAMKESLRALAVQCATSGRRLVVLVDEAMHLPPEALQAMLELAIARSPADKALQFVLASVDPLTDRISEAGQGALPAGLVRELEIHPMEPAEIETYIRDELSAAGLSPSLFSEEAVQAAVLRSHGVIRILNRVCQGAMRTALNLGNKEVTARHFRVSGSPREWSGQDKPSGHSGLPMPKPRRQWAGVATAMNSARAAASSGSPSKIAGRKIGGEAQKPSTVHRSESRRPPPSRRVDRTWNWSYAVVVGTILLAFGGLSLVLFPDVLQSPKVASRSPEPDNEQNPLEVTELSRFSESDRASASFDADGADAPSVPSGTIPATGDDPRRDTEESEKRAIEIMQLRELAARQREAGDLDGAMATVGQALSLTTGDPTYRLIENDLLLERRADQERRQEIVRLREEAERQRAGGDLPGAIASVERALILNGGNEELRSYRVGLLAELQAGEEGDLIVENSVAAAERQRSEGDLAAALRTIDRSLSLHPDRQELLSLRAELLDEQNAAQEAIDGEVRALRELAARQRDEGDMTGAIDTIDRALEFRLDDEDLLAFRSDILARQQAAEERAREVARLRDTAEQQRSDDDLPAAIRSLEQALALDADNAELQSLQSELVAQHQAAEARAAEIARLTEDALGKRKQGDLTAAVKSVEQASALDAGNADIQALHATLLEELKAEEARRREVTRLGAVAREQRADRNLAGAIESVEQALTLDDRNPELLALRTELFAEQVAIEERDREVGRLREEASRQRAVGNLDGAIQRVEEALALDESDAYLQALQTQLLAEQQAIEERTREIARLGEAAEQQRAEGNLAEALESIEKALALDDSKSELQALRTEVLAEQQAIEARDQEVARLGDMADQQRADGDLAGAIQSLDQALALNESAAGLKALRSDVLAEQQAIEARHQEVALLRETALQQRAEGDLTEALGSIDQGLALDDANADLQALRTEVLAEQQAIEARDQEVARLGEMAGQQRDEGDLAGAIQSLEQALALNESAAGLKALRGDLLAEQQAIEARDQEVALLRETALQQRAEGNLAGTLESIDQGLSLDDSNADLQALRTEVLAEQQAIEERTREIARLSEAAEQQRADGNLAGAIQSIGDALGLDESDPDLQALRAELLTEQQSIEARDQEVARLRALADQQRADGNLAGAVQSLGQALALNESATGIEALRSELLSEQQAIEARDEEVARLGQLAGQQRDEGDLAGAVQSLDQALALNESAAGFEALRSELLAEQQAIEARNQEVALLRETAIQQRAEGDLTEALGSIDQGLALDDSNADLQALRTEVLAEQQAIEARDQEVARLGELAGQQRDEGDLAGAIQSLEQALTLNESAAGLEALRSELLAEQQAIQARNQEVALLRETALQQRAEGNLAGTLESIDQGLALDDSNADLQALRTEILAEQQAIEARDEEVARLGEMAGQQRADGDLAGAIQSLDQALALNESAAGLKALRGDLLAEQQAIEARNQEVALLRETALQQRAEGNLAGTLESIDQGLSLDDSNADLQALRTEVLAEQQAIEARDQEVARLGELAGQQRDEGDLAGAIQSLEQALVLNESAAGLEAFRSELLAEQQATDARDQEVARFAEMAGQQRAEGNLTEALESIDQGLALDDSNAALQTLRTELLAEQQAIEARDQQVARLREVADQQRADADFPGAMRSIEQALALDDSNTDLRTLQTEIRDEQLAVEQRDREVARLHAVAEQQRVDGDLTGAISTLQQALDLNPDRVDLAALESELAEERRSADERLGTLTELYESASRNRADGNLAAALENVEQGLAIDPENADFRVLQFDLLAESQMAQESASSATGMSDTGESLAGGLANTIESLARVLGLKSDPSSMQSLESKTMTDAQGAAATGVPIEEREVADMAAGESQPALEVAAVMSESYQSAAVSESRPLTVEVPPEAEAYDPAGEISRLRRAAIEMRKDGNLSGAIAAVEQALALNDADADIQALQAELLAEQRAIKARMREVARLYRTANQRRSAGDIAGAIESTDQALAIEPDSTELRALRSQLVAEQQAGSEAPQQPAETADTTRTAETGTSKTTLQSLAEALGLKPEDESLRSLQLGAQPEPATVAVPGGEPAEAVAEESGLAATTGQSSSETADPLPAAVAAESDAESALALTATEGMVTDAAREAMRLRDDALEMQRAGDLDGAIAAVEQALALMGDSPALAALRADLLESADLGASTTADEQSAAVDNPLIGRGDGLLRIGDVASARLFYQEAVVSGDERAAMNLGMTFDPIVMNQLGILGAYTDRGLAESWYRRAIEAGVPEATERLERLLAMP